MRRDRYVPQEPPYLLYALLGASLAMNLYMVLDRDVPEPLSETVVASELVAAPEVLVEQVPMVPAQGALLSAAELSEAAPVVVVPPALRVEAEVPRPSGFQGGGADVRHSLACTFQSEVKEGADALTAVFGRVFMWDLDLRRHVQQGDEVLLAWAPTEDATRPDLPIAVYKSHKLGRTLRAYRYTAPGDAFASYWNESGEEVARRLVGGPIEDYEQITSLVRDRPNHHGIDFKAPVGTDVLSPKAGTVTRVNWNTGANGGCVEVRYADGTLARFLHLSEARVRKGHHVKAGQVIALSGNSGNSTAPHLHYELSRGRKYLDPLEYPGTVRRQLEESALPTFRREIARLDALLGGSFAAL